MIFPFVLTKKSLALVIPVVLALVVSLIAGVVVVRADHNERQVLGAAERNQVHDQLELIRSQLERSLVVPMARTRGIEAQIVAHGDIQADEFNKIASILLRGHSTISYISVSHGTMVDLIYPLEGHQQALGIKYQDVERQWPTLKRAIEGRSMMIEGPESLIGGGFGLIVHQPVILMAPGGGEGRFFGVVSVALDIPAIYAQSGLDREDLPIQVAIRGQDGLGQKGEVIKGDAALFYDHPVLLDVEFPNGSWQLAAIPKKGWGSTVPSLPMSRLLSWEMLFFVITISFATAFHVIWRSKLLEIAKVSEERFRCMLQFACDGVHILDEKGNLVIWSPSFIQMLGYSNEEARTLNLRSWDAFFPEDVLIARTRELIKTRAVFQTRHRRRDGSEFDVEISAGGIELGGNQYLYASSRDISERRRAEQEISRYRDHLESLVIERTVALTESNQKLAEAKDRADAASRAKSAFLANMSHEIRTPLNAILGFSHIMLKNTNIDQKDRETIKIINRSGRNLLMLINDILEMSKIEADRIEVAVVIVDIYELLNDIMRLFSKQADNKKLHFEITKTTKLPQYIKIDGEKLRHILINLIGNALKFTEKGCVSLQVDISNHDHCHLIFDVKDTGLGIPATELACLFEPFQQTANGSRKGGGGLGLAISRRYARLMGGEISVRSVLGQGSVFRLELPAQDVSADEVSAVRPFLQRQGLWRADREIRIVVADDQRDNRSHLVHLLEPFGFAVRKATNGAEAVALWREWHPHLIVMDMAMPVMDGCEVIRQIKTAPEGRDVVIIVLSATIHDEDREKIIAVGASDLLRKPVLEEDMLAMIQRHLKISFDDMPNEKTESAIAEASEVLLQPEMIDAIPPDLLEAMKKAVFRSDDQKLMMLIDQLPPDQSRLASGLRCLAAKFDWEVLDRFFG